MWCSGASFVADRMNGIDGIGPIFCMFCGGPRQGGQGKAE